MSVAKIMAQAMADADGVDGPAYETLARAAIAALDAAGFAIVPKDEAAKVREREALLLDALNPFVKAFAESLEGTERLKMDYGDPLPLDNEKADEIYSWALNITWGDLRKARAAIRALGEKKG
jgi:hypothetical protein